MQPNVLERGVYLGEVDYTTSSGGLRITSTFYQDNARAGLMHAHENPHFSFVLCGGNLEKRKHTELHRLPGTLTFYHSGEFHQNLHGHQMSKHLNIEVEPTFFELTNSNEQALSRISISDPANKLLLLKLYKEISCQDDVSTFGAQMLFLQLMQNGEPLKRSYPAWVKVLKEYLHQHYGQSFTLHELAWITGVHPVTISKHFPAYCGCTLGDYVRKLRIERALTLIKTTTLTLSQIAAACGFADQSHFIRNFKTYTGFMPKEFQRL